MNAARPAIALNGVPSFQMRSVGSYCRSGKEKGRKKGMTGGILQHWISKLSLIIEYVTKGNYAIL